MCDNNIISSPFPSVDIPNISVGEYMLNQLKKFDNSSPVLIDGITGECLTAQQLISQANKVAVSLLNRGITKSDVICYFSANSIQYAILKFAAYFLGVTSVHSKPTNNVFELENVVSTSEPTYIFTSAVNAPIVEKVLASSERIKLISVFDGIYKDYLPFNTLIDEAVDENLTKIPYFDVNPREDICEIVYTSGTSGIPKGAMLSNYAFLSGIILFAQLSDTNADYEHIAICVFAFGHIGGTMFLPLMLSRKWKVIFHQQSDQFEDILKSIEKHKVTFLQVVILHGSQLIEGPLVDKYDLSSLKIVMQGGTHFPDFIARAIINKYSVEFMNVYGLTECMGVNKNCSTQYIDGSCGLIAPNAKLKIVDLNTGKTLSANQTGEICVKSPAVFSGYLRNKAAFDEAIDTDGFLHTGDVGHYDECGRLYCTDRIKEMIKVVLEIGQFSAAPAEIEQQLLRHKAVEQTVVVGVQQPTGLQYPRAYIVQKPGYTVTAEEIQHFVKENMSVYNQLRGGVVFVDQIVRTFEVGKTDRKYYRNLANQVVIG